MGRQKRIFGDVIKFLWTTNPEHVYKLKKRALMEGRSASEILIDALYLYLGEVKGKGRKPLKLEKVKNTEDAEDKGVEE